MSVVVWDGVCLEADDQGTLNGRRMRVKKLYQPSPGLSIAFCGDHEEGLMLMGWYLAGANPAGWPAFQKPDSFTTLVVAFEGKCVYYQALPIAQDVIDKYQAWGDGAPYALGAMAMGAKARQAIGIASYFSIYCGVILDAAPAV